MQSLTSHGRKNRQDMQVDDPDSIWEKGSGSFKAGQKYAMSMV
jgi:hypothetical protein